MRMRTTKQGVRDLGGNQRRAAPVDAQDACFHEWGFSECYCDLSMETCSCREFCKKCGVDRMKARQWL